MSARAKDSPYRVKLAQRLRTEPPSTVISEFIRCIVAQQRGEQSPDEDLYSAELDRRLGVDEP